MNGNKKVILHLIFDGILFDQVYSCFEKMENYENIYLLGKICSNRNFQFITNTEKVLSVSSKDEWGRIIGDPKVDIIYLHGLWRDYLNAVDYINDNVVVMWWCYGMEIYENTFGMPSLLGLNIYKPKTLKFLLSQGNFFIKISHRLLYYHPKIYTILRRVFNCVFRRPEGKLKKFLSRIDYAFTPLEMELDELKSKHNYIKAKPYKLRGTIIKEPIVIHNITGNVLLEHSAQISNNHLDIIDVLKRNQIDFNGRDVYIPLSYGIRKLGERIKEEVNFKGANVHCLMEALPFDEYKKMLDGCTHAIFGMIRQSGLGNIYMCFRKGIKVFLFKDSILYKQFKADGYDIFSIEDDLNDDSIREPLTESQALNNYNLFYNQWPDLGSYQEQMDRFLNEYKDDKH